MGKTSVKVNCIDQRLLVSSGPVIASGGHNEDELIFSFCPLWDGYEKIATFYRDKDHVYHAIIESDKCVIPWEVLTDAGEFYFGVFGVKNDVQRTSHVVKYKVAEGAISEDTSPSDPTPDIYTQIISAHNDVSTRLQNHMKETDNPHGVKAIRESVSANARRIEALETYEPRSFEYVGNPVILENYENMPINCVVSMQPVQSGSETPSPTNVRSISGRSSVRVHRMGRNLMNVDYSAPSVLTRAKAEAITGGVRIASTESSDYGFGSWYLDIPIEGADMVGKTLTLSCKAAASGGNTPRMRVSVYNANRLNIGQSISADGVGNLSVTYTIGNGEVAKGNRLGILFYPFEPNEHHAAGTYADFTDIQLELGNTVTEYEPPANAFGISFGQTVYGGTLDVSSGVLTVDRAVVTLTGNESWTRADNWKNPYAYYNTSMMPDAVRVDGYNTVADVLCSHAPVASMDAVANTSGIIAVGQGGGAQLAVCFGHHETADDLKNYLSAQADPVQICFRLKNPQTVHLSPVEIAALEGLNTVYSTGDSLTISGRTDILWLTSNMIERLSAVNEVTDTGTKAVSGAAVADYVAKQIAAITDYEGVEF